MMTKRNTDVQGNAVASAAMFARQMEKSGVALIRIQEGFERLQEYDIWLLGINLTCKNGPGEEWLAVVKAEVEGVRKVCFQGGVSLSDVVQGLAGRIQSGRFDWRDDKWANK